MTSPAPRRRHSPAVYRRRRLVLILALVVVAAAVALLVWQPWNAAPASRITPSASTSPSVSGSPLVPGPTESPDATIPESPDAAPDAQETGDAQPAVAECNEGSVEVVPVTDKEAYAAGENPQLSISLTNRSEAPCTLNVGTTTQSFMIVSGNDVWWRSTDCQTEPSDQIVTIGAGQTVSSVTPLVWDRTRSSVSTCGDADRPAAPGGGSSFHLSVSIGGLDAGGTRQFILY